MGREESEEVRRVDSRARRRDYDRPTSRAAIPELHRF